MEQRIKVTQMHIFESPLWGGFLFKKEGHYRVLETEHTGGKID